ncbi:NADPH:quinone reductase [filamentous cyanobacterium CCP5]|nr:NADPH:quinone reductase [filamentous cyanobacterium CCP5]
MRVIQVQRFGGPEVMELATAADLKPEAGQVVVSIQAAGVNPVDTYIRGGQYARRPDLPYIPGIDGAGTVIAVGSGSNWQVGDRVYGGWPLTGTYGEQALYAADQLYSLPPQISFPEGAGIFVPYSTAYRALMLKGLARPGATVLIHGATGSVGLAAVQIAVNAGMRVLGTGGSEQGRERVLAQGADQVFDHHDEGYLQAIAAATDGVDVVLEMLADVNLEADLQLLNRGGRVVIIGSRGRIGITPREIMAREAVVTGMTLFSTPPEEMAEIQAALGAGLRQGTLKPIVAQRFFLSEAALAHQRIITTPSAGNLVLLPTETEGPYSPL